MSLEPTRNLSLFTASLHAASRSRFNNTRLTAENQIPVAWALCYVPHAYAVALLGPDSFDISNPRSYREVLTKDTSIPKVLKERISRAEAASLNGLESIGVYAAAVVAGTFVGLDNDVLNRLSMTYVGSRIAYNLFYVFVQNKPLQWTRSGIWVVGFSAILSLYVKAGMKVAYGE